MRRFTREIRCILQYYVLILFSLLHSSNNNKKSTRLRCPSSENSWMNSCITNCIAYMKVFPDKMLTWEFEVACFFQSHHLVKWRSVVLLLYACKKCTHTTVLFGTWWWDCFQWQCEVYPNTVCLKLIIQKTRILRLIVFFKTHEGQSRVRLQDFWTSSDLKVYRF